MFLKSLFLLFFVVFFHYKQPGRFKSLSQPTDETQSHKFILTADEEKHELFTFQELESGNICNLC